MTSLYASDFAAQIDRSHYCLCYLKPVVTKVWKWRFFSRLGPRDHFLHTGTLKKVRFSPLNTHVFTKQTRQSCSRYFIQHKNAKNPQHILKWFLTIFRGISCLKQHWTKACSYRGRLKSRWCEDLFQSKSESFSRMFRWLLWLEIVMYTSFYTMLEDGYKFLRSYWIKQHWTQARSYRGTAFR